MAQKIYLVEDEVTLNILIEKYLQNEGYEVVSFTNGGEAAKRIKDNPDMWILDITLPEVDGYELIKKIKKHNQNTPVIFISARNEELDRVVGLELGSDDYLSKPFLPRELIIRVNLLMNRVYETVDKVENDVFVIDGYEISRTQHSIRLENENFSLTHNEFELLMYFIENKNNVLSRDDILREVWQVDHTGSGRVVDDTIRRLRKKLENISIETVHGYGYKLVVK